MHTKKFLEKVNNQEKNVIAIDFVGVIHKNTLGYHDGTVYDEPIVGAIDSIKMLSSQYEIIIFSCKALEDRPRVNGKTGIELIEEWLEKHEILEYIKEVTFKKPRAAIYIDDKGFRFVDWSKTVSFITKELK